MGRESYDLIAERLNILFQDHTVTPIEIANIMFLYVETIASDMSEITTMLYGKKEYERYQHMYEDLVDILRYSEGLRR